MQCPAQRFLPLVFAALTCNVVGCAVLRRVSQADSTIAFKDAVPSVAASPNEPQRTAPAVQPAGAATAKLLFLDPYQPGKVPVVLIHGLFSSPEDWADAIGNLRAAPGFADRFQIWAFGYPTGQGFLQSAAALRIQLRAAVDTLDPQRIDPSLHRMALVGHSMGGLIAKLQVTYSDELVWSRVANRPLEEIVTTDSTRAFLAETCYFDPSPDVARVILIASPHCGSLHSSAIVGHCISKFIQPKPQQANMHEQLMRDNPSTFYPVVERRFPTSIDMLVPSSPLLDAMREMRLRPDVALHTILGVSHPLSLDGPSDGVVSVYSASHPGCQSVLAVNAHHARVHHRLETSLEILRILNCDSSMNSAPARILPPGVGIELPSNSGNTQPLSLKPHDLRQHSVDSRRVSKYVWVLGKKPRPLRCTTLRDNKSAESLAAPAAGICIGSPGRSACGQGFSGSGVACHIFMMPTRLRPIRRWPSEPNATSPEFQELPPTV